MVYLSLLFYNPFLFKYLLFLIYIAHWWFANSENTQFFKISLKFSASTLGWCDPMRSISSKFPTSILVLMLSDKVFVFLIKLCKTTVDLIIEFATSGLHEINVWNILNLLANIPKLFSIILLAVESFSLNMRLSSDRFLPP